MRKQKTAIAGFVSFLDDSGHLINVDVLELGSYLKPSFNGMLDGHIVNNRLFIMELQSYGFKVSTIFHYETRDEMNDIRKSYQDTCKNAITQTIKSYNITPIDVQLSLQDVYDVDYCDLSLAEMENDLSADEIKKVLECSEQYKSTVQTKRKQSVFFG